MSAAALLLGLVLHPSHAAPVARAGQSFLAYPGESIRLDGSASEAVQPEENANLEWRWVQVGGPRVPLMHADTVAPELYADLPGRYTFELTVHSSDQVSQPDQVDVLVVDPEVGSRYAPTGGCAVRPLPASAWWWAGLVGVVLVGRRRNA